MSSDDVSAWPVVATIVFLTAAAAAGALMVVAGVPLPAVDVPPVQTRTLPLLAIGLLGAIVGTIAVRGEPAPVRVRARRG